MSAPEPYHLRSRLEQSSVGHPDSILQPGDRLPSIASTTPSGAVERAVDPRAVISQLAHIVSLLKTLAQKRSDIPFTSGRDGLDFLRPG
jgi:hypothetical protein